MIETKFKKSELGLIPEDWENLPLWRIGDINKNANTPFPNKFKYIDLEAVSAGKLGVCKNYDKENAPCAEVLKAFYRERLREALSVRLVQWGDKLGEDVDTFSWSIIKMKKQWGSCLTEKRKIQFNLLLARVPLHCIDYIVVHEICHLKVHRHDKLFIKLLNQAMPEWRNLKKELDDFVTLPME